MKFSVLHLHFTSIIKSWNYFNNTLKYASINLKHSIVHAFVYISLPYRFLNKSFWIILEETFSIQYTRPSTDIETARTVERNKLNKTRYVRWRLERLHRPTSGQTEPRPLRTGSASSSWCCSESRPWASRVSSYDSSRGSSTSIRRAPSEVGN